MENPIEKQIVRRAYELWEQAGKPEGRDQEFYHLAEQELRDADPHHCAPRTICKYGQELPVFFGIGWVCENHPDRTWREELAACGAGAGMPCKCNFGCVSAWNKNPVFGVIGIQSGPGLRVHTGFHFHGS